MKKILKRLATGFLAFATIATACRLPCLYFQEAILVESTGRVRLWKGKCYVSGNVLQPISRHYLYFKLVNLVFTKNGDNVKVKVAVISLDNHTMDTQVAQYELVLYKDSNWKIVG